MQSAANDKRYNPLNMRKLEEGGPFVLPSTSCSARRVEFFRRGNTILGFYSAMAITSRAGEGAISQGEEKGEFKPDTQFRLTMGPNGGVIQMNYGLYKKHFANAGIHLTNQVFLMLYGNFEAYLCDLVLDALTHLGSIVDPYEETLQLMVTSRWRGKIDRIDKKLDIGIRLGTRTFVSMFRDIDMEFLGERCENPIEFLGKVADLRHRLVHSSGRVDSEFVAAYPKAGLLPGQTISLPFGTPLPIQLFFARLTDVFDEAFSKKYGWHRTIVSPETLTE